MEIRKFAIGEQVRLLSDGNSGSNRADVYTVCLTLPAMANVWQYQVRRVGDGLQRAVTEQQLAKVGFLSSANRSIPELQRDHQRLRNARASERVRLMTMRSEGAKVARQAARNPGKAKGPD